MRIGARRASFAAKAAKRRVRLGRDARLETLEQRLLLSSTSLLEQQPLSSGSVIYMQNGDYTSAFTLAGSTPQGQPLQALAADWGQPGWQFRRQAVVDHTKVTGNLTDYPLLVSLTDSHLAGHAQSDADDLVFTGSDGTTKLAYELESYDSTTGTVVAWVKLPSLSSVQDTALFVYYGNAAVGSQAQPQAVWDSNYLAVHHLEETSGLVSDSTVYARNGTPLNGVAQDQAGVIDGADAFDGVNDRITLPQVFDSEGQFTFEAWIYSTNTQGYAISQRNTAGQGAFIQYYPSSGSIEFYVGSGRVARTASAQQWHHVVGTYDGSTARLYLDGAAVGSAAASLAWPDLATYLGDRATLGRALQGRLDEVRLSSSARSGDYIATSYANQTAPGSFMAVGPVETSEAPVITAQTPADGQQDVPVNLTQLTFELLSPSGETMDYTVNTSPGIGSASGNDVSSGQFTVDISSLLPGTDYSWTVTATSAGGASTTRTFSFTTAQEGTGWGYTEWQYRRTITIDHTKVNANQTNFPVLIRLTDPDVLTHAQVDGRDLLFTSADGQTKLAHEIEWFDSASGAVAWVKVPVLSSTEDTILYLYYGNDTEDMDQQAQPQDVWDSGYMAVHHMEEKSGNLQDSTVNDRDGTPVNGIVQDVTGRIDGADQFDGVDDRLQLQQLYTNQARFSFEGWVYSGNKQGYVFSQRDSASAGVFLQYYSPTGVFQLYVGSGKIDVSATANAWHYVVVTYDGTTARMYVDDRAPGQVNTALTWGQTNTYVGNNSTTFNRPFQGTLDELRFSDVARSQSFVRTSYANQSNPATFYALGEREVSDASIAISDTYPANNAMEVELNPVLKAKIREIDGNAFDWKVELFVNGQWQVLQSGQNQVGPIDLSVQTSINLYETQYLWKVSAWLSGGGNGLNEQISSFTTRRMGNYAPRIDNVTPADDATAVELNPTLSADVVDIDGDPMDIVFSVYSGGQWRELIRYNGVSGGTYTADATGFMSNPTTAYQWRLRATDTVSGQVTTGVYDLTTGGGMRLKWTTQVDMSGAIEPQIQPAMGDVDNDGVQEIVFTAGDSLWVLNGITGAIEWSIRGGARDRAVELVDLNNDGTPEILHGMLGCRLRAVNGNGTIRWTSAKLPGEDHPMFPICAYDIDGDGYPTIYFTSEDVTPETWSGNLSDYEGSICMLDHNGNLLARQWRYHPCWGGIALGDANQDGVFELYVSDRRYGYNNVPAQGLAAYNAHTLEPLWYRPDIHHSSPVPILADVVGDSKLELVAQKIVSNGPIVLDPITGKTLLDWSNTGIPVHGVGTVYDLDGDGHKEYIGGTSYPMTEPMDFVVFDLVTGEVKFHPTFDYHTTWAPKLADINGDGKMEILAAMGDQSTGGSYPVLVYNNEYKLIDRVVVTNAGQLSPARAFDCDSDGYHEVVVAGVRGIIAAYDTYGPTPNPAPNTWVQMYSTYRAGVAEYVEPAGPPAAVFRNVTPADNTSGVGIAPTLSLRAHDFQFDTFDLTFQIRVRDGSGWRWQTLASYQDRTNGTFTASTAGYATEAGCEYMWRVIATDEHGNTSEKAFTFTMRSSSVWGKPDWTYRRQIAIDRTKVTGNLTNFPVLVTLTAASLASHAQEDGDDIIFTASDGVTILPHEIESYNPATGALTAWVKVPSLSSTQDTALYMYYGNASVGSQQQPTAVWDSDFLAVQHLEETSGTLGDSTSYNRDGTPLNGLSQDVTGKIDGADRFDGTNDRVQMSRVYTTQNQFTVEGWFYSDPQQGYIFSQRDTAGSGAFIQYYPTTGRFQFYIGSAHADVTATAGAWHYVVATYDGTTARLYVDNRTPTSVNGSVTWPNISTILGNNSTSFTRPFKGMMDEVRFSDVARNSSYIATSYANQNNPGTFMLIRDEEQAGPDAGQSPVITLVGPQDGGKYANPSALTQLVFNVNDPQGDLMEVYVETDPNVGSLHLTNFAGGQVTVPLSALEPWKTYNWVVSVSDGTHWQYRYYTFSTAGSMVVDGNFNASSSNDELTNNGVGQDWYESRQQEPTLVTLDDSNVGGNSTRKAAISASTTHDAYLTQEFGQPVTSRCTVEFDIYIDSIVNLSGTSNPDRTGWIFVGSDNDGNGRPNTTNERFVMLAFAKDGGGTTGAMNLVARDHDDGWSGLTTVATGLSLDTWYDMRLEIDVAGGYYDVYVNDALRGRVMKRMPMVTVDNITFANLLDGAGSFYVDNVQVSTDLGALLAAEPELPPQPQTALASADQPAVSVTAVQDIAQPDDDGEAGSLDAIAEAGQIQLDGVAPAGQTAAPVVAAVYDAEDVAELAYSVWQSQNVAKPSSQLDLEMDDLLDAVPTVI